MKYSTAAATHTTFGLLRHGQTVWNAEKRIQGLGDSPLTPAGIEQTRSWASFLHSRGYARILCSDLERVKQTVEILNQTLDLPITVDQQLREQNWGAWEGMTLKDVRIRFKDELDKQVQAGWHFRAPDGESRDEVRRRLFTALESAHCRFGEKKILVVCHLGVIKCLLYSIHNRQFLPGEPKLLKKNGLHEIIRDEHGFRASQLNIECHAGTA